MAAMRAARILVAVMAFTIARPRCPGSNVSPSFCSGSNLGNLYTESGQTWKGSFSAAAAAVDRIIFKN